MPLDGLDCRSAGEGKEGVDCRDFEGACADLECRQPPIMVYVVCMWRYLYHAVTGGDDDQGRWQKRRRIFRKKKVEMHSTCVMI